MEDDLKGIIPESDLIKNTIITWLESLDHEYMLLLVVVTWGITESKNMSWLPRKLGGKMGAIWKIGIFLGLLEMVRNAPISGWIGEIIHGVIIVFESFLIMMASVEHIISKINEYLKVLKQLKK